MFMWETADLTELKANGDHRQQQISETMSTEAMAKILLCLHRYEDLYCNIFKEFVKSITSIQLKSTLTAVGFDVIMSLHNHPDRNFTSDLRQCKPT